MLAPIVFVFNRPQLFLQCYHQTAEELNKLMNQFRKVTFMSVNTKKITFEAEFPGAPDEDDKLAFVVLKRLADSHEAPPVDIKGKAIKIGAAVYKGTFDQSRVVGG